MKRPLDYGRGILKYLSTWIEAQCRCRFTVALKPSEDQHPAIR